MKKATKNRGESFVAAVSDGELDDAERLLASGVDINEPIDSQTPLHFAVSSRSSISGFKWLLDHGAMLDVRDGNDLTPLMTVCNRSGERATEMALTLISAGCDVKARRKGDGMSAMEFAAKSASPVVLRALAEKGASIDGVSDSKLFPVLMAVRAGNLENVKTLVELGCDLSKKVQLPWAKGKTCLEVARLENHHSVAKCLERIGATE